jgi:hypothetical protein
MTDYPLITGNLLTRRADQFTKAIALAKAAVTAGQIANPAYQDSKSQINHALSDAWTQAISEPYVYAGRYESLPREVHTFYCDLGLAPELHTIVGRLRKVQATKLTHPMIDAMRAFLLEAVSLSDLFARLKPLVVKRQPKPVEDRKARYDAPEASVTAIGIVKAHLVMITEAAYADLLAAIQAHKSGLVEGFLEAQAKAKVAGRKHTLRDHFRRSRSYGYNIVSQVVDHNDVLVSDWEATIARLAAEEADEIREMFVYKNLAKLDSILEAKGDFVHAEVVGQHIELGALRGTLRFSFADGASFVVQNDVVWSHSIYGKPFRRFPLTFRNVVMAGGVKMERPSEERMNSLFVGKQADTTAMLAMSS